MDSWRLFCLPFPSIEPRVSSFSLKYASSSFPFASRTFDHSRFFQPPSRRPRRPLPMAPNRARFPCFSPFFLSSFSSPLPLPPPLPLPLCRILPCRHTPQTTMNPPPVHPQKWRIATYKATVCLSAAPSLRRPLDLSASHLLAPAQRSFPFFFSCTSRILLSLRLVFFCTIGSFIVSLTSRILAWVCQGQRVFLNFFVFFPFFFFSFGMKKHGHLAFFFFPPLPF